MSAVNTPPDPKDVQRFCQKMTDWAEVMMGHGGGASANFDTAWPTVVAAIYKSCLLDRMMYGGENPSKTPCPVHKGIWSGCHFTWPGRMWSDGKPVDVPKTLQDWYDAGCRCAYHRCGCTTGWQPDETCGCGGEETWKKAMAERHPKVA